MNIIEVYKQFPTEKHCIDYLERQRWPQGPVCPYCQAGKSCKSGYRHHCNACNKSYSVMVGTMFHYTHIPLQKWFLAVALITNAKKGISSAQLARDLQIRPNTAWSMQMRIRKAMKEEAKLQGVIEMDETYIGGKGSKNKKSRTGRGTNKEAIVGMVERGGRARAYVQDKSLLNNTGLIALAERNVELDKSMIITDEYRGYNYFEERVRHKTINHSKEYVDCLVHTNNIEGFWATLKRSFAGQYHCVTVRHLQSYIDESVFKYNNRRNPNIWQTLIERAIAA